MRGSTFQNDWRSDIRIVTSGVEPTARAEPTLQEQQRFIRELTNIDRATPPKRMRWRDHGHCVRRIEQAAEEQLVTGAGKYNLHVALSKAVADASSAILDKVHLNAGMLAAEAGDKGRQHGLDILRAGSYPQSPGEPSSCGPRPERSARSS